MVDEEFVVTVTLPGTPEHFIRSCSGVVSIGRAPEAGIALVHPLVSRRHAELSLQGGRLVVQDLNSSNGTVVNDEHLTGASRAVGFPAVVQIGPYVLNVASAEQVLDETLRAKPPEEQTRLGLDRGMHTLLVDGKPVIQSLVGLEYRLVDTLVAAKGKLVENQSLGDGLWGAGAWDPYMLHNLVRRVRRKLEEKGLAGEELIVSVPGGGYRSA
jgi:pSer/pThr/pTyr-binding forkhead associated (FHA) protein